MYLNYSCLKSIFLNLICLFSENLGDKEKHLFAPLLFAEKFNFNKMSTSVTCEIKENDNQ